jgi:hypothetical protein
MMVRVSVAAGGRTRPPWLKPLFIWVFDAGLFDYAQGRL